VRVSLEASVEDEQSFRAEECSQFANFATDGRHNATKAFETIMLSALVLVFSFFQPAKPFVEN